MIETETEDAFAAFRNSRKKAKKAPKERHPKKSETMTLPPTGKTAMMVATARATQEAGRPVVLVDPPAHLVEAFENALDDHVEVYVPPRPSGGLTITAAPPHRSDEEATEVYLAEDEDGPLTAAPHLPPAGQTVAPREEFDFDTLLSRVLSSPEFLEAVGREVAGRVPTSVTPAPTAASPTTLRENVEKYVARNPGVSLDHLCDVAEAEGWTTAANVRHRIMRMVRGFEGYLDKNERAEGRLKLNSAGRRLRRFRAD